MKPAPADILIAIVRFEDDKSDPYLWPRPAPPVDYSMYKGLFKLPETDESKKPQPAGKDVKAAV